jgi:homoaconitase/3-isopropylmalate dehydratase large subunit
VSAIEKWLPSTSRSSASCLDAQYAASRQVDLGEVSPMVALPGTIINNAGPVGDVAGTKIDQAFTGSCANGQLADLEIAARILKGRQVASSTRLIVTPQASGSTPKPHVPATSLTSPKRGQP